MNDRGIVGAVYRSGSGEIVHDAYADPRFAREVDQETGFKTEAILCAPVKSAKGDTIGVIEILNKLEGEFDEDDLSMLEGMTSQCAITLQSVQLLEHMTRSRQREIEFLNLVSDLTSELELGRLLGKVISESTRMLDAERSTLFLNDEKTGELFSYIGEQLDTEIRFPNHVGIAGAVFTNGQSIRIPYAYADLRFNPTFDRQTGFFTRSILCVPVFNKAGKAIGVTQALNKRGGPFTSDDESRLRAFTAQIATSLENAKLFADVQAMKNYNDSMLQSMSNGVITFDDDGTAQTCNAAAARILRSEVSQVVGKSSKDLFGEENRWLRDRMKRVTETLDTELAMDAELRVGSETVSANVTVLPLLTESRTHLGTLVMIEDISTEKRVKSTLSRYMDPDLADRLLASDGGEEILGGTRIRRDGSLLGHPQLHDDLRGARPAPHGRAAERLLRANGRLHLGALGHARQVHRRRDHGRVRPSGCRRRRRGPRVARGDRDDQEPSRVERRARGRGEPVIDMGIGLNTNSVVAGNIGSPKRMDYTIIGDGVNLAARLESACKQYGARILLWDLTASRLKGIYRLREVDKVIVKGKTQPVSIFESLDYHDDASFPKMMETIGLFAEGLARYREGDFASATTWFEKALAANPGDRLSAIYVERCRQLSKSPPPADWDGAWAMSEK